jgi:hypothetical protein
MYAYEDLSSRTVRSVNIVGCVAMKRSNSVLVRRLEAGYNWQAESSTSSACHCRFNRCLQTELHYSRLSRSASACTTRRVFVKMETGAASHTRGLMQTPPSEYVPSPFSCPSQTKHKTQPSRLESSGIKRPVRPSQEANQLQSSPLPYIRLLR